ncbi:unnamed protein product [Moneuplotes crassus]|uniref:Uncharacterized protein n=1 Tax=Euplotes crassus TaxID=5936 RepID=A0AAD1Y7S9_EUPCR|nr:unnamed protein product [Moneuplotes crassus]
MSDTEDTKEKMELMKEDYASEWFEANDIDEFDLEEKLMRVGCRPLKRKFLAFQKQNDGSELAYTKIKKMRQQLDNCYELLEYMQIAKARKLLK